MPTLQEVTLHTTPSSWTNHNLPPTSEHYQRVVGVSTELGSVACRFEIATPTTGSTYQVTQDFAARLLGFFDRYTADIDPERWSVASEMLAPIYRYNCHTFALHMLGEDISDRSYVYQRIPELNKRYTPTLGPLAAGRHGIIRSQNYPDRISHSVIGLGEDIPVCIQVMNSDSNIALVPYEALPTVFMGGYRPVELYRPYELAA